MGIDVATGHMNHALGIIRFTKDSYQISTLLK